MNDPWQELIALEIPEWHSDGLCAQVDPELFFPEKGQNVREAKLVCGGCDVREQCLAYALDNNEQYGIWAGTTQRERAQMRRDLREAS